MTQRLRRKGAILAAHAAAALVLAAPARAADCDGNGVEDAIDVAPTGPGYRLARKHFLPQAVSDVLPRDMNADGKADLVGLVERESILVALGEGDGRWAEPAVAPIPDSHDAFLVEDLDGDGYPDAVTAGPQTLAFFFNDGRGGLRRAPSEDVLVGSHIIDIQSTDVDGDGWRDLVTLNELENISVIRNGGGRRFDVPRNHASGIAPDELPAKLVTADLDGDGHVDLGLSANKTYRELIISFLWNDGHGRFQEVSSWRRPWLSATLEGHADFDEDGDEDLYVAAAGRLVVLKTDSGRVPAEVNFPFDLYVSTPFLLEDLDLDGRSEIILSPWRCSPGMVLSPQGDSYVESMSIPAHRTFHGRLRVADLDGDGDKDLLVFEGGAIHLLARELDFAGGDCNGNLVPDACEDDCNANGFPDACDIGVGESGDCDGNGVPDECDPDCNRNRAPDRCEIRDGAAEDCNGNGVPDACDVPDRNGNAMPDACEIAAGRALDCNANGIPDDAEAATRLVLDSEVARSSFPSSFSIADMDGDGAEEILTSNKGRGMNLLLWNEHVGFRFQALEAGIPWQLQLGNHAVVDFDTDGDLDLAILAYPPRCGHAMLGILENLGDERFRPGRWHCSPELSESLLLAGDFDGDGRTDILTWSSAPLLFRGSPGGLGEPRQLSMGETLQFRDIASVDLDRDGDLDLVTDTGIIFSNPGDAAFLDGGRFPAVPEAFVKVLDFGGDGLEDILTQGILAENRGGGIFVERRLTSENLLDAAVADFDGDSLDDIVLELVERLLVLLQRGRGLFATSHRQPGYGDDIEAADVNGDGRPDLAVLRSGGVVVHWNLADPAFGGLVRFVGDGLVASLEAADVDGDGDMDLAGRVLRELQSELAFWVNDGAGSLVMERALSLDSSRFPARDSGDGLVARDMDGDGDVEFAVPDAAGLILLERVPDGRLSRVSVLEPGNSIRNVMALDFDRDGDQDLAAQSSEGQIFVFLSRGWPAFDSVRVARPFSEARGLSSGDLDGDGDEDLLQATAAGVFSILNAGDRGFSAVAVSGVEGEPHACVLADLDEDGDADLVVSHCPPVLGCEGEPLVTFLRNDGGGIFGNRASWQVQHLSRDIEAVDLDGDGDVDLVLPQGAGLSRGPGMFGVFAEILVNLGHGELRSQGAAWIGAIPGPVAATDLDRDGTLDIALGTWEGLAILPLDINPPPEPDADGDGILDSCSPAPFRRGDWNADGRVDLTDAVALLGRLFLGGEATGCDDSGDADDDGKLDLTDPLRILRHLFQGDAAPPAPHEECGEDPTVDGLACLGHRGC